MDYLQSEHIISEVEQHPCVYDPEHEGFKNRKLRRSAWTEITKNVVGDEWEDMHAESQQHVGKEVQNRWKSMKDSYLKYLKSGGANKQKKPYIYHRQMSFLLPRSGHRPRSEDRKVNLPDLSGCSLQSEQETMSETEPAPAIKRPRMPKEHKQDPFERDVADILTPNPQSASRHVQDPDEMFLLSQLPVIKQLCQSDKMDFQIKFIQLLQSYNKPSV